MKLGIGLGLFRATDSKTLALLLCCSAISSPISAMELKDLLIDAVQSNPDVLQRVHRYQQILEDEDIAASGWWPKLDLTSSYGDYSTRSPITSQLDRDYESYEAAITLTQNLFDGRDTSNAVKQAKARAQSEMMRIFDDADNLSLEITGLYLDTLTQSHLLDLASESVAIHEDILAKIQEQNLSGVGRASSEELVIGRLAQARSGYIAQQNNLMDALTKLHYVAGRYLLPEELVVPDIPEMPQITHIDVLLDIALDSHPAIKSAAYNVQAAEYGYARTRSPFLPKVDLKLQRLEGDDIGGYVGPTDETSIYLEMTYNLYNGGADSSDRQKKLTAIHEHREFSNKVRRQVIQSLRLSWAASEALDRQLVYLNDYVESAKKALAINLEEFQIGERTLTELLNAEDEFINAKVKQTEAQFEKYQTVYRVHEGLGALFDAVGIDVRIEDDHLYLVALDTMEPVTKYFDEDKDQDQVSRNKDHCDRSVLFVDVNPFGCSNDINPEYGFQVQQAPIFLEEEPKQPGAPEVIIEKAITNLNFEYDSYELSTEALGDLNRLIKDFQAWNSSEYLISIQAHSDSVASREYNLDLSQKRADHVRARFIQAGFLPQSLEAIGMGEDYPIADNDIEEGRAINRRVEFLVTRAGRGSDIGRITEQLTFAYDSVELADEGEVVLERIVSELESWGLGSHIIEIHAHTDSVASQEYNQSLSQSRADFVKQRMIDMGYKERQIHTYGHGEKYPIVSNATEEGRNKNRRVEFIVKLAGVGEN